MCLLTDILSYLFLDAALYYKGTTVHTESPVAWETHRLLNALGPQGATSYTRPVLVPSPNSTGIPILRFPMWLIAYPLYTPDTSDSPPPHDSLSWVQGGCAKDTSVWYLVVVESSTWSVSMSRGWGCASSVFSPAWQHFTSTTLSSILFRGESLSGPGDGPRMCCYGERPPPRHDALRWLWIVDNDVCLFART